MMLGRRLEEGWYDSCSEALGQVECSTSSGVGSEEIPNGLLCEKERKWTCRGMAGESGEKTGRG